MQILKWTAQDFASAPEGSLPMGQAPDEWSYGDLDAGFKNAAIVVDETFVVQSTGHQPMESRSAMAYWQNGKLYLHGSTQSVARTLDPLAGWLGIDASNIVLVSEYCGGGFGSKGAGAISMVIPALLSKKTGAPVMMRISREEEHYIGRARTGMVGRARAGFMKDGRIAALDLFIVEDNGSYGPMGDYRSAALAASLIWQPIAMRWRGLAVLTNTPPRSQQRSPGPMQANAIMEPVVTKAAKKLGLDQVAIRRINSPEGKALYGPVRPNGQRGHITSAFVKEALDRGAELFKWDERKARSGTAPGIEGARRRRRRRTARGRIDRLRRSDDAAARRQAVRAIRRRQPGHAFVHRPRARRGRRARDAVGQGRRQLGQHREEHSVVRDVGRQPDDPRDDPGEHGGRRGCAAEAADDCRQGSGRRACRLRADERACAPPRQPLARPHLRAGREPGDCARRNVRRPRAARRHPPDDEEVGSRAGRPRA